MVAKDGLVAVFKTHLYVRVPQPSTPVTRSHDPLARQSRPPYKGGMASLYIKESGRGGVLLWRDGLVAVLKAHLHVRVPAPMEGLPGLWP